MTNHSQTLTARVIYQEGEGQTPFSLLALRRHGHYLNQKVHPTTRTPSPALCLSLVLVNLCIGFHTDPTPNHCLIMMYQTLSNNKPTQRFLNYHLT